MRVTKDKGRSPELPRKSPDEQIRLSLLRTGCAAHSHKRPARLSSARVTIHQKTCRCKRFSAGHCFGIRITGFRDRLNSVGLAFFLLPDVCFPFPVSRSLFPVPRSRRCLFATSYPQRRMPKSACQKPSNSSQNRSKRRRFPSKSDQKGAHFVMPILTFGGVAPSGASARADLAFRRGQKGDSRGAKSPVQKLSTIYTKGRRARRDGGRLRTPGLSAAHGPDQKGVRNLFLMMIC